MIKSLISQNNLNHKKLVSVCLLYFNENFIYKLIKLFKLLNIKNYKFPHFGSCIHFLF